MLQFGQMRVERLSRMLFLTGFCVILGVVVSSPVATAPPDSLRAELHGACYCRTMSQLKCVGVVTQTECNKQCAEALCDDWFWMERLTCWNWGYGG
jgi:hypothetical protein